MGSNDNVIHIVPEESVLLDMRSKFPCTIKGCDRTLPNYGALKMHLVKTHKHYQSDSDRALGLKVKSLNTTRYVYHCPVNTCPKHYNQGETTSHFTSMKLLKQHYGKLHAEKKFVCAKCERGFGLERDKRRHEERCGFLLKCKTCDCPYSTVEAMLTHCRRKGHEPPEECNSKKKAKDSNKNKNKVSEKAELQPPQNIFLINVLPSPNCPTSLNPLGTDGFRHILPKPVVQPTVPFAALTSSSGPVLVPRDNCPPKQSVDTQTGHRQSVAISAGVQTSARNDGTVGSSENSVGRMMEGFGNRDERTSVMDDCERFGQINYQGASTLTPNNYTHPTNSSSSTLAKQRFKHGYNLTETGELVGALAEPARLAKGNRADFGINPDYSLSSTRGIQTLMSLPLKSKLSIAVAETQTPGDYILTQAMASANIALSKVSTGSQVSPRAKAKGQRDVIHVNSQSCQTSRLTDHIRSPRRKKQRKSVSRDCAVINNNSRAQRGRRFSVDQGVLSRDHYLSSLPADERLTCHQGLITGGQGFDQIGSRRRVSTGEVRHYPSHITRRSAMLIDGPQNEDLPGSLPEFEELTDHQTQTMGLIEELNSLAASISTQTHHSYLAQPSGQVSVPEVTNIQHMYTQTRVSAFTPVESQVRTDQKQVGEDFGQSLRAQTCVQSPIRFTNSNVQTSATDLLNLLDTGIQADSGPGTTTHTQTEVDDIWDLFCHNMETQTADNLLHDLAFSDIQIQTNLDLESFEENSSSAETQTMWHAMGTGCVAQSDMQTQTLFPAVTFDPDLTDSHTQTPWDDITSVILQNL